MRCIAPFLRQGKRAGPSVVRINNPCPYEMRNDKKDEFLNLVGMGRFCFDGMPGDGSLDLRNRLLEAILKLW